MSCVFNDFQLAIGNEFDQTGDEVEIDVDEEPVCKMSFSQVIE